MVFFMWLYALKQMPVPPPTVLIETEKWLGVFVRLTYPVLIVALVLALLDVLL